MNSSRRHAAARKDYIVVYRSSCFKLNQASGELNNSVLISEFFQYLYYRLYDLNLKKRGEYDIPQINV
jgi:hypothetical protein